jgi:hypothetical protein
MFRTKYLPFILPGADTHRIRLAGCHWDIMYSRDDLWISIEYRVLLGWCHFVQSTPFESSSNAPVTMPVHRVARPKLSPFHDQQLFTQNAVEESVSGIVLIGGKCPVSLLRSHLLK